MVWQLQTHSQKSHTSGQLMGETVASMSSLSAFQFPQLLQVRDVAQVSPARQAVVCLTVESRQSLAVCNIILRLMVGARLVA